jgi:hypothetical protein
MAGAGEAPATSWGGTILRSKILEDKNEDDIWEPEPIYFTLGNRQIPVLPMPDSVRITIAKNITAVVNIAQEFSNLGINQSSSLGKLAPIAPMILEFLLPNATAIIAGCLRKSPEWVERCLWGGKKMEVLNIILDAEDIPMIIKKCKELATKMPGIASTPTVSPAPASTTS